LSVHTYSGSAILKVFKLCDAFFKASKRLQADRNTLRQQRNIFASTAINQEIRRIATRYDRLARNYLVSVCLAAALVWWNYC
jgi:hypothetical protein